MATEVIFKKGMNKPGIKVMQIKLKKIADQSIHAQFDPHEYEGLFGQGTFDAVRAFQDWRGLPLTGELDLNTRNSVAAVAVNPKIYAPSVLDPSQTASEMNAAAAALLAYRKRISGQAAAEAKRAQQIAAAVAAKQEAAETQKEQIELMRQKSTITGIIADNPVIIAGSIAALIGAYYFFSSSPKPKPAEVKG